MREKARANGRNRRRDISTKQRRTRLWWARYGGWVIVDDIRAGFCCLSGGGGGLDQKRMFCRNFC